MNVPEDSGARFDGGPSSMGIAPGGCVRPDLPKGGGDPWDPDDWDPRPEPPRQSSMGIGPGGCIPPNHWPKDDDDVGTLGAADLNSDIDWMTWNHPELYAMATQGLDVAGANAVAAKWGDIGVLLQEVAEDLERAARRCEQGWEGSAAELARDTAAKLAQWSEDTGHRAHEAGTCVSRQTDIAVRAAREMPEPVPLPQPMPRPLPEPSPRPFPESSGGNAGSGSTVAMSAGDSSPFVSQDLGSANKLTGDVFGPLEESRAAHRQAAEVMKTMQHESAEVYSTVPWFAPPKKEQPPEDRGRRPDDDAKPRTPEDPRKSDTSTSSTSGVGAVSGGGAAAGGAVGALGGGAPAENAPRLSGGALSGVGGNAPGPAGAGATTAPAASGAGAAPRGMGAMPMGAMGGAGAGRSEDQSRQRKSPVLGEKGMFDPDRNDIHRKLLGEDVDDEMPRRRH